MTQTIQANSGAVLIPRRELRERIPVSDMTIWRWVRDGVFPKPVSINRRNYWRAKDVEIWLGEIIYVSEAMKIAGVSDETIRRWCVKHGIGRKYRAYTWSDNVWQVSRPGLLIVMAKDWDALQALIAGDRSSRFLLPYLSG